MDISRKIYRFFLIASLFLLISAAIFTSLAMAEAGAGNGDGGSCCFVRCQHGECYANKSPCTCYCTPKGLPVCKGGQGGVQLI